MDILEIIEFSLSLLVAVLVIASIVHASIIAMKPAAQGTFFKPKVMIICGLHLLTVAGVYRYLIIDGWLTNNYHWNDPDIFNLVLAIFEALCAAAVIALAIARKSFFYKLLVDFLVIQILLGIGFVTMLVIFPLTWHPKMF